ncbi:hypothetical protein [Rhodovibrio sodomensis]|nr:hypothetical protein [Rhodovibrio sodomensis]
MRELLWANPRRFADPVAWEPLFEVAARRDCAWDAENAAGVTTRA